MLADEDGRRGRPGDDGRSALARRVGDTDTELHAMVNLGSIRMQKGDRGRRRRARGGAPASGRRPACDDEAGRALVNLGSIAVDWADYDLAADVLDRALPFTIARDLDGYTRHMLGHRARVRLVRGDWRAARDDAEQALAGPEQPGACLVPALIVRGLIRARRGEAGGHADLELAAERAYRTGECSSSGRPRSRWPSTCGWPGEPDRAAAEAKRGLEVAERGGHPWLVGELAVLAVALRPAGRGAARSRPSRTGLLIDGDWRGAAEEWTARCLPVPPGRGAGLR